MKELYKEKSIRKEEYYTLQGRNSVKKNHTKEVTIQKIEKNNQKKVNKRGYSIQKKNYMMKDYIKK